MRYPTQLKPLEGSNMNEACAEVAARPVANAGRRRLADAVKPALVLTLALVATLAVLAIGIPWCHYRYDHLVIRNATLKGTVTKLGSRIDGQIQSFAVEVGQRVARGGVLA